MLLHLQEQLKDAIAHDATTHDDVLSFQHKFTGQQNPNGKSTMQQDNEVRKIQLLCKVQE